MTKTTRTLVPALLLAAGILGSAHAAPAAADAVQVQVELAAPGAQAEAPARVEPDGELAADMAERLDPRVIGGIAGAIGIFSIVSAIRRRRTQQQEGLPKPV